MEIVNEIYKQLGRESRKKEHFYVTDIGTCPRKVIMNFGDYEKKPLTPQEQLMFGFADFLHYKVMLLLKESRRYLVIKNEYDISAGLPASWHGRLDDILYDLRDKCFFPLEIKSTRGFVKNMELPKDNHVMQTKIYIHALEAMGWEIPYGKLVYFDRSGSNKPQEFDIKLNDNDINDIKNEFLRYEKYYCNITAILEVNGIKSYTPEPNRKELLPDILPRVIKKTKNEFKLIPDWQCSYCNYQGLSCNPIMSDNKIAEIKDSKLIMRKDYEQYENDIRNICKLEIDN